ncbi:hypothetical protein Btru_018242 [Bulinus truncatus]|nr:hypothetical protein Btru_018242 [Bulinus truncatus]
MRSRFSVIFVLFCVICQYSEAKDNYLVPVSDNEKTEIGTFVQDSTVRIVIENVWKVDNKDINDRYQSKKNEISISSITQLTDMTYTKNPNNKMEPAKTSSRLPNRLRNIINPSINEFYMFHGTSRDISKKISEEGFKLGSSSGNLFGSGVYTTETLKKAAAYPRNCNSERSIIVARIVMGRMHECDNKTLGRQCAAAVNSNEHSILYPRNPREFIALNADQVVPEYVVDYNISNARSRRDVDDEYDDGCSRAATHLPLPIMIICFCAFVEKSIY